MCSVVGCDSWRRSAQRFKLPEDPERRLEWVQFILEVNGQRLKESSWTDITICRHHFTDDCFEHLDPTAAVQLKSSAVPSVCVKSEPDEPDQEPEETTEVASQCDQLKTCDSSYSHSEESGPTSAAAQESLAPSDASDDSMFDYSQMIQNIENIDMIRIKAALLQMKGKYVVNEKHLLQLFSHKCPLCGSKVKMEKVTYGVLIILNQQCLQCDYRNQWKSQVSGSVPTAEHQRLTEVVKVEITPERKQTVSTDDNCSTTTGMPDIIAVIEKTNPMDETEGSCDEGDMNSDEDWKPVEELSLANELHDESEEESEDEEEDFDDYPPLDYRYSQLCTECGKFFNKYKPHMCMHKIKPYSCNICGKRCVSEIALNTHSRIHDENYEHRCKYCHLTFKTKGGKITHEQIHVTQGKPYKCPDCSDTFATNNERRIHLEDHRGPPQLKCHICGIDFTRTMSLRRHLAVHTGVKPFKCSVCQRGFSQASHLKSHMRLHTGERPYKCQHCDKCFNHNVSLKSHVQRYHTPNPGREQRKGKKNNSESSTVNAEENGNNRGTDMGLDNVEEEQDKAEEVQMMLKYLPKSNYYRSTGRPIGRPKRNAAGHLVPAGEIQDQCSNTKKTKGKVRKLNRTRCSDEESKDEPTNSDEYFDSTEEEEENSEKVTSRGREENSDSDSEFDPEEREKKRCSSQNRGENSESAGEDQNQVVEDT